MRTFAFKDDHSDIDRGHVRYRYIWLDMLRFLSALYVLLFHYFFRAESTPYYIGGDVWAPAVLSYGYLGVDVFFVISGFIITFSIQGKSPADFFKSRVLRLYPAYWTCITITFCFLAMVPSPIRDVTLWQFIINITMFQEFFGVGHIDGVYWTLTRELQFYILVYILIVTGMIRKSYEIFCLWLLVSVLAMLFLPPDSLVSRGIAAESAPAFILGISFYQWLIGRRYSITLLLAAFLACIYSVSLRTNSVSSRLGIELSESLSLVIFVSFFFLFVLSVMIKSKFVSTSMMLKILTALGASTYPLYLIHQAVGYQIMVGLGDTDGFVRSAIAISMVLLAILIARFPERVLRNKLAGYWRRQ